MTDTTCLDDSDLWPAVMGDSLGTSVVHHLASCASCQIRVESLQRSVQEVQELDPFVSSSTGPEQDDLALPKSIGEYPILSRLGTGGQADVYRAWHPRLRTDVVVKWYRNDVFPSMNSSQVISEAHVLSRIRHPNLGQVFDVGIEQGRHYLIMEYVSGQTFSAWLRRTRPSIPRIMTVVAKSAWAVDAVHRHGALHLDIKPGNILVDELEQPRVIDFGMVALQGTVQSDSVVAPVTPEFMAPEQCMGDMRLISEASDVYGLGAVLFFSLCDQPIRSSDRLSLEPDWSLIAHVPRSLRRICQKALAIRPSDRYESASVLAEELERFVCQNSLSQRVLSLILIVFGAISLAWGGYAMSNRTMATTLHIERRWTWMTPHYVESETACAAVLSEQRRPCLMFVTATTPAIQITELNLEEDADLKIGSLKGRRNTLRVAESAGPYLILACGQREWPSDVENRLNQLLHSLNDFSGIESLSIQLTPDRIMPLSLRSSSGHSAIPSVQQRLCDRVSEIQELLNETLPCYSALVEIPSSVPLVVAHR